MKEVAIGDVCDLVNGRAFKPSDWSAQGLPIVRIQNLNNEEAPFNRYDGEVRERFLIDSGALLFSWSGTPGTSFGAFFWNRGRAILNQHIFHVLPRSGVDKNYLRYALNGRIERIIAQAHGGVGLQHITKDKLEATTIPLPVLGEQRRIAEILDKADAIRRRRKEAIALTEELLRSAFLEMFGDPVTNPKGWDLKPFDAVVRDGTGGNAKVQQSDYEPNGAVPIIDQGADFIGGWTSRGELVAKVSLPAVLFGDHTKTLKWVDRPFVLGADGVKVLVPGPVLTPEYLYMACRIFPFPDVGYSRHFKFLKLWHLPVPPLNLQRGFAALFRRVLASQPHRTAGAATAEILFSSLVSRAFSGAL